MWDGIYADVTDQKNIAQALTHSLERLDLAQRAGHSARGHVVEIVHDGDGAIRAAQHFQPEAVLLDLGLPGMDGYEVAEHLRRDPALRQPTIIAISGYGQEEDRRRSSAAGFDHHLVKSVSFTQLETMLRSLPAHE